MSGKTKELKGEVMIQYIMKRFNYTRKQAIDSIPKGKSKWFAQSLFVALFYLFYCLEKKVKKSLQSLFTYVTLIPWLQKA